MRHLRTVFIAFFAFVFVLTASNLTDVLANALYDGTVYTSKRIPYVIKSQSSFLYGIKAELIVQETEAYLAALHHPVFNSTLDEYVQGAIEEVLNRVEVEALQHYKGLPQSRLMLYGDYELFSYSEDIISIKFDITISGSLPTRRHIVTLTLDMVGETLLLTDNLFANHFIDLNHYVFTPEHLVCYTLAENGYDVNEEKIKLSELVGMVNFRVLNRAPAPRSTSNSPKIALTFDDGPHPEYTQHILKELKKRNAVGTFFVLGERVQTEPRIVRRMVKEGHEIGNHTWNHPNLRLLSAIEVAEQLSRTTAAIKEVTGVNPRVMRPPFGFYGEHVKEASELPIILWSIDPKDWDNQDPEFIVENIVGKARNGDIILLHDIYSSTAQAVGPLVDKLTAKGFEFVTVSELLGLYDYPASALTGKVLNKK